MAMSAGCTTLIRDIFREGKIRHIHATLMLKARVHPKVVSERLGYTNVSITRDTYSHVLPGLQEAAAERFDGLLGQEIANAAGDKNVSKEL